MEPVSLYVHVPFCEQKCAYCDFYTLTDPDKTHPLFDRWLDLCVEEFRLWKHDHPLLQGRPITTIFLGGGTPSLLTPDSYAEFIQKIKDEADLLPDIEITLETQPGTLKSDQFKAMCQAGINRFSIGIQTFQETYLLPTGRRHTVAESEAALTAAKATSAAVSLDLICALPGQTLHDWHEDLKRALDFQPHHISAYELTYHAGTDYYRQWKRGTIRETDDSLRAEMFLHTRSLLINQGFHHYEISNYARPGQESRHNLVYWTLGDFVGLGAGAHSHINGHRYANPRHAGDYARTIRKGHLFARPHDSDDPDITLVENLQMVLRRTDGIDLNHLADLLGQDIRETRTQQLNTLRDRGWITFTGNLIRLTNEGQLYADSVSEALL